MTLAFDQVVVHQAGAPERRLTAQEFLALPLHERVQLLVSTRLAFFLGKTPVDQLKALKSLRA